MVIGSIRMVTALIVLARSQLAQAQREPPKAPDRATQ